MQNLKYSRARDIDEAARLLAEGGPTARVLAGGTDVIVQARERKRQVGLFVDIKKIAAVQELRYDAAAGLTVGAATPCYRIYEDDVVQRLYPALVEATSVVGGTAIQDRASLGGNLCNSSPAADTVPAMIALDADVSIAGPGGGRRTVAAADFCTGPGQNVLAQGEFVVSILFPPPASGSGAAWERFIPRNEMDIAVANAASYLLIEGGSVSAARIAIGAVAPTALLLDDAAAALVGKPLSDETIAAAAAAAKTAARPIDDMRGSIKQRRHLAGVLVERTLCLAAERAEGGRP